MRETGDKTVFRPKGASNPEHTIIRPTPGRRRNSAPSRSSSPRPSAPLNQSNVRYSDKQFETSIGLNPIVKAASNLIAVFEKTRNAVSHPDVAGLHSRLGAELRDFHGNIQALGYKPEIALAARYIMCSALDEAVLNTPWGAESQWPQKTLLSVFHNETSGGEKFFKILERMRANPAENLEMIEFFYVLTSLGFEGRYRFADRGRDALERIRDDLFSIIRNYRGEYERSLAADWRGAGQLKKGLTSYLPMWVLASILAALLVVSYSGFRYWLFDSSAPVVEQLSKIIEEDNQP